MYECNLELTWLNRHALKRDNVVQFVGNVMHGDAHETEWVVNVSLHCCRLQSLATLIMSFVYNR